VNSHDQFELGDVLRAVVLAYPERVTIREVSDSVLLLEPAVRECLESLVAECTIEQDGNGYRATKETYEYHTTTIQEHQEELTRGTVSFMTTPDGGLRVRYEDAQLTIDALDLDVYQRAINNAITTRDKWRDRR
jgi:hypothetical protein